MPTKISNNPITTVAVAFTFLLPGKFITRVSCGTKNDATPSTTKRMPMIVIGSIFFTVAYVRNDVIKMFFLENYVIIGSLVP